MPIVTHYVSVVLSSLVSRARGEQGQTMAEYGILVAVIAIVVVVVAITLGGAIARFLTRPGVTSSSAGSPVRRSFAWGLSAPNAA
jgi:Flp pilus assembly pilin Flp